MIKNYVIWTEDGEEHEDGFENVYNQEKIEQIADLTGCNIYMTDLQASIRDLKDITGQFKIFAMTEGCALNDLTSIADLLHAFFDRIGFSTDIRPAQDFESPDDILVYDFNTAEFYNLNDYNTVDNVLWLNPDKDWVHEIFTDYMTSTVLAVDTDTAKDLDIWDGSNLYTSNHAEHETFYKVVEQDGQPVRDTYLVCRGSDWEGVHSTAKVMCLSELTEYLKSIDRSPDDYLD